MTRRQKLFACVAGIILAASFPVGAPARTFPPQAVTESTLPNGLRLVVRELPGCPLAAASLWVHAGSRNEGPASNGVAHLLEHYLFEDNTPDASATYDREIEAIGGTLNAETSRDHTHFYVIVPQAGIETSIRILGQMVEHPKLEDALIEVERRRATDEVEQRTSDPILSAQQELFAVAYHASPYRLPIAGTPQSVSRLTPSVIRAFYHTYYRPDNATLVVVGDVTPTRVAAMAARVFGAWPRPTEALPDVAQEPERITDAAPAVIPLKETAPLSLVMIGFPAPSVRLARDSVVMDLIYSLLASGPNGILSREMSRTGLLNDISSDFLTSRDPGLFLIWGYAPVNRIVEARQRTLEIVRSLGAGAFGDEDVSRAKSNLLGSYNLENETVNDQATGLGFYDSIATYEYAVEYDMVVQSLTRNDIQRVAHDYFQGSYTIIMAPPGAPTG